MIGGDAMVCPDDGTRCDEPAEGRKSARWRYVNSSDDGRYWPWIHPCVYAMVSISHLLFSISVAVYVEEHWEWLDEEVDFF